LSLFFAFLLTSKEPFWDLPSTYTFIALVSTPELCVAPRYVSPSPPLSPHFLNNLLKRKNLWENEIIRVNQEEKEVFFNVFFVAFDYCKMNVHFNTRIFLWFFVVIVYWRMNKLQDKKNYIFSNFFLVHIDEWDNDVHYSMFIIFFFFLFCYYICCKMNNNYGR